MLRNFIIVAFLLFNVNASSQSFIKVFGDSSNTGLHGSWVRQLSDGSYIVLGQSSSGVKLYRFMNEVKIQEITLPFVSYTPYSVASFSNYQYKITGQDANYNTAFLLTIDSLGGVIYNGSPIYGAVGLTNGIGIINSPDHGAIWLYWSNDEMGFNPTYLERIDSLGNYIGGTTSSFNQNAAGANSVTFTSDGGFLSVAPYEYNYYDSCCQYYVSKIKRFNQNANLIWIKELAPDYQAIDTASGGGSIVINQSFMTRLDSTGDSLWTKYYPITFSPHYPDPVIVRSTYDGGFLIYGTGVLPGKTDTDIILYKTDNNGDSLWMKSISFCGSELSANIEITPDSGFIISGTTYSYGSSEKAIVARLNKNGDMLSNPFPLAVNSRDGFCGSDSATITAPCGFAYAWSTGATVQEINVNQPGIYFASLTDTFGNIFQTDTVTLNTFALPTPDLGNDTAYCDVQQFILSPGNYISYLWNDFSSDSVYYPSGTGIISVSVTDSNGCINSDSIYIILNHPPSVYLGADTSICFMESLVLSVDTNYISVLWNNSSNAHSIIADSTGIYYVSVTDSNNCSATDFINVFINALPQVSVGNDTSVCPQIFPISVNGNFQSVVWQDTINSAVVLISHSGSYHVEVIDSNGCSNRDTININFYSQPVVNLGNDTVLCINNPLTLNAGAGFDNYVWSDGSLMQTLTVNSAIPVNSIYFIQATDSSECIATDTIVVSFTVCAGLSNIVKPDVNIFPNPFDSQIYFSFANNDQYNFELFDISGKLIYNSAVKSETILDTRNISQGIYFYVLRNSENYFTGKIIR